MVGERNFGRLTDPASKSANSSHKCALSIRTRWRRVQESARLVVDPALWNHARRHSIHALAKAAQISEKTVKSLRRGERIPPYASGGHPSASQKLPTRFTTLLSARTRRSSIYQVFGTSDKSSISRHTGRLSARTKRVSVSIFQRSRFTTHGGVNLQVATSPQSPFSGHTRLVSQNIFQRSVYTTQSGTRSEFATSRQSSSTRHTRRVSQNIFRPRSHTK